MKRTSKVVPGSGNVFADLQLEAPEELRAKAELTAQIARIIAVKGLNQSEAADLLGLDQPKVSALLRGKLDGFSTERLLRLLVSLGTDVKIVVTPHPRAKTPGHIKVVGEDARR